MKATGAVRAHVSRIPGEHWKPEAQEQYGSPRVLHTSFVMPAGHAALQQSSHAITPQAKRWHAAKRALQRCKT